MLSREENETLTRVGPGTQAGAMLRRYWWPVAFTEAIKAKGAPAKVRLLGEDFVLFRDGGGNLGLLELHCSHRGTSLEFGRVEEVGIRCCYHGWLYDLGGKCLEQPAEPEGSAFKERIQHPAFHAREAWVEGVARPRITHFIFPAHVRHSAARVGEQPRQVIRFRVPVDDCTTHTFWIDFYPHKDGQATQPDALRTKGFRKSQPGVYERVQDGWWNLPNREQDRVAQESQGVIADRSKEHLASSDQGIAMLRKMIWDSIESVHAGKDPIGVIRDTGQNESITFDSSRDAVEALA